MNCFDSARERLCECDIEPLGSTSHGASILGSAWYLIGSLGGLSVEIVIFVGTYCPVIHRAMDREQKRFMRVWWYH